MINDQENVTNIPSSSIEIEEENVTNIPSSSIEIEEMNQRIDVLDDLDQPGDDLDQPGRGLLATREVNRSMCVPMYEASITGNWESARVILGVNRDYTSLPITKGGDTALHIAASAAEETNLAVSFVNHLVSDMTKEELEIQNKNGNTALCLAAAAGNTNIVRIMVNAHPDLVNIPGANEMMPLHMSALHGKYETVKFLYTASGDMRSDPWTDANRSWILFRCIEYDFFDVAMKIVRDHPIVAGSGYVLEALARKPHALNGVKRSLLITRIKNSIFRITHTREDTHALQLLTIVWRDTIKRMQRHELDKMLIRGPPDQIPTVDDRTDRQRTYSSSGILFVAAEMGNTIFVMELLQHDPDLIWETNDFGHTIFHIAVMHRHQGIYNLLYQIGSRKDQITLLKDEEGNNMLHLVGMTSRERPTDTSRASLLMQRELLWFKEVEKMIPLVNRKQKNNAGETPYQIFSSKNHNLLAESLKWVKDCMVVATLIVTIAFAVAFTVPGGYQSNGLPVFIHKTSFKVFVIADAISLSSSTTSLLVYLSILASRYEHYDSLLLLTRKLMIGLMTLFISVAAMMVTFSASFFVLYRNGMKWIPILISAFAILPLIAFARLQYRLLVDMFPSMHSSMFQFNPQKRTLYNRF